MRKVEKPCNACEQNVNKLLQKGTAVMQSENDRLTQRGSVHEAWGMARPSALLDPRETKLTKYREEKIAQSDCASHHSKWLKTISSYCHTPLIEVKLRELFRPSYVRP